MKHLKTYKIFESSDPYKDLKKIILEKCQPFIELSKSCDIPIKLWRGVSEDFIRTKAKEVCYLTYEVSHISNRKPTDTPNILHERLNKEFENKFGWPVRNGVFCLPDKGIAQTYASISSDKLNKFDYPEPYFFIPIGEFKYCWSPKYHDLTADIKVKGENWKDEMESLSDIKIKNIVNTYKDTDISDANYNTYKRKDASEISFNCDKYLLISQRYFVSKVFDFWNW
jgi:hypothetical protein